MRLKKDSGIYSLVIKLDREQKIKIGNLGVINFPKGFYFYTGSALNGLTKRIERHRRRQKKLFWHIDYLLNSKDAKIFHVIAIKTDKRLECHLNQLVSKLENAKIVAEGFGCSDCDCETHLFYFDEETLMRILEDTIKRLSS